MRANSILHLVGNTPLVELPRLSPRPGVRLFAKLEGQNPTGSIKDRIARFMVEAALAEGRLSPGQTIVEATTGNTGISLAWVGRLLGHPVKVVVPQNIVPEVVQMLAVYGAEIIWSSPEGGMREATARARQLARQEGYFLPGQFENWANPQAHYQTTGAELLAQLPQIDVLVAGLGTGGTLMGVGRRLKEHNPNTRLIAVEPHPGIQLQGLRSLQDGFVPPILDLSLLDSKLLVHSHQAFAALGRLIAEEGILGGISSGACLHGALRVAEQMSRGNIVVVMADGGWKYLSARPWLKAAPAELEELESTFWW